MHNRKCDVDLRCEVAISTLISAPWQLQTAFLKTRRASEKKLQELKYSENCQGAQLSTSPNRVGAHTYSVWRRHSLPPLSQLNNMKQHKLPGAAGVGCGGPRLCVVGLAGSSGKELLNRKRLLIIKWIEFCNQPHDLLNFGVPKEFS